MNLDDTIAAVATPAGSGGVGVVRLSGPNAMSIAAGLFRGAPLTEAPTHSLHHGTLHDGETLLDDAVAAVFRSPRSYTGEDVVELSCHGGSHILRRVLETCLRAGARLADPGEFTRRSFLNGKMDLAQAESVADLIAARSDSQHRLALNMLRGELSRAVQPARETLLHLLAHVEANLDFVEDEVPALTRAHLLDPLRNLLHDLALLKERSERGRFWRDGLRIAIGGRPNVGKSSLFNALLKSERAIVTDQPGTTRDTLEESLSWDSMAVTLVDTAGLRDTDDAVEREGTARARQTVANADLIFLVVDASAPPVFDDRAAADAVANRPVILVLNKMDRIPWKDRIAVEDKWGHFLSLKPLGVAAVSAITGEGLDVLRQKAVESVRGGREPSESGLVFNARQEQRLNEALGALGRARDGAETGAPDESVAVDLHAALNALNALTGRGAPEEVLDAVFSRFCVGK
jgi:tRNA modification GTPase